MESSITKNTQGTQQWGLKGREENKSRYQEAKDEKRLKERERMREGGESQPGN